MTQKKVVYKIAVWNLKYAIINHTFLNLIKYIANENK